MYQSQNSSQPNWYKRDAASFNSYASSARFTSAAAAFTSQSTVTESTSSTDASPEPSGTQPPSHGSSRSRISETVETGSSTVTVSHDSTAIGTVTDIMPGIAFGTGVGVGTVVGTGPWAASGVPLPARARTWTWKRPLQRPAKATRSIANGRKAPGVPVPLKVAPRV